MDKIEHESCIQNACVGDTIIVKYDVDGISAGERCIVIGLDEEDDEEDGYLYIKIENKSGNKAWINAEDDQDFDLFRNVNK